MLKEKLCMVVCLCIILETRKKCKLEMCPAHVL